MLVVGAAGQLGQTVVAHLRPRRPTVAVTRAELDLCRADAVGAAIDRLRPSAIVNCAGYNAVDRAEQEPEAAMEANAFAVLSLARAAAAAGAVLLHFSSDFVFDGETDRPYTEDDRPNPRSLYAASKLLGEWFAADTPAHYVLRVESLFGGVRLRKSSLDRIIRSIADGTPIQAFADRTVSPSYAWDVADATERLLQTRPPAGVYHCVNGGAATWHDVAIEVRRLLDTETPIEPIAMADVVLPAVRPRYCALSNEKLRRAGVPLPTWQDALRRCLETAPP